jgi:hypothetical protein
VADPIRVRACSGAANQRWELTGIGELRGVNGLCIKVDPASSANASRRGRPPAAVAPAHSVVVPLSGLLRRDDPQAGSPRLGLRCEEGRGSLEDLSLLLKPPETLAQLLVLIARQAIVALATIELVSLDPVTQRLLRDTEAHRNVTDRVPSTNNPTASRRKSSG